MSTAYAGDFAHVYELFGELVDFDDLKSVVRPYHRLSFMDCYYYEQQHHLDLQRQYM